MFDIRSVNFESAEQLLYLWRETFKQAYEEVHTPENIQAYCANNFTLDAAVEVLSDDKTVCCIAYQDDRPSGYYIVKHHNCPIELKQSASELKQIYILASQYGLGVGRAVFKHASSLVQDAGYEGIWLCVSDINYRAQSFYKKLNFTPVGPGPVFDVGTDRLSSTVMVYWL